ncbi:hypothetical protein [Sphingobium sp. B12D2B]|uniref:hypothetical protein n=1 Tax=Sphingobium sp. B12D2B TaxID=2940577 RepID=UPI002224987B|nr:hypothetical protein [Sphingobium sp. B12D2B]MCW2351773.1 hypothetical protein [Sphingobium sp. B12D2B]
MYDLRTHQSTKDMPGGPQYIPQEHLVPIQFADRDDNQPLTHGKLIGSIVSLGLLAATGAYLLLAF